MHYVIAKSLNEVILFTKWGVCTLLIHDIFIIKNVNLLSLPFKKKQVARFVACKNISTR
jgi:hypothetical protein